MRFNKMSDTTKILIFAGTIIIVCVLCALGFKMANEGKASVSAGTSKYNEMASSQDDTELMAYDGSTILGNQLVDLIKKTVDAGESKYLSIHVKTLKNKDGRSYNYKLEKDGDTYKLAEITSNKDEDRYAPNTVNPKNTQDANYINPMSEFYGSVVKDLNGNVICLNFEQLP